VFRNVVQRKILAESVQEHGANENIGGGLSGTWCKGEYWLRVFRNMVLRKILAEGVQERGAKENTG
jgi:hypothetical protein